MSTNNPFAPKRLPERVNKTEKTKVNTPMEDTVPEGSINEIMEWVGSDKQKAKKALDHEKNESNRKTLVAKLEDVLSA